MDFEGLHGDVAPDLGGGEASIELRELAARGLGQERQGTVVSAGADKTIVVRVETVKLNPRYKTVVKRYTRLHAHDEENNAKLGDVARIVETRPLSRLKRWRLQEIVEAAK